VLCLLAASALGFLSVTAHADRGGERYDRGRDDDRGRDGYRGGGRGGERGGLSLDAAVGLVVSRFGGQVVRAEAQSRDGQLFYFIRVLTSDGVLVRVRVDAQTGRMD
jgi:uncharacterized membrane protein YkoI